MISNRTPRISRTALAVLAGCLVAPAAAAPDGTARVVLEALQSARRAAGSPPLQHRPELDAVAMRRARQVAALPERRRRSSLPPIDTLLREAGIQAFTRAGYRLDLRSGYADPVSAFLGSWKRSSMAWNEVVDPSRDAIGVARHVAEDGWHVFVAVFVDDRPPPPDPLMLERQVFRGVNRVRRKHGLVVLEEDGRLALAARGHSQDMARNDYFDHRSLVGELPAQRAKRQGVDFLRLGENIQYNGNYDDPVGTAIEAWLGSPGHRRTMLDPAFRRTGVGAAIDGEGRIYFTQMFLTPGN